MKSRPSRAPLSAVLTACAVSVAQPAIAQTAASSPPAAVATSQAGAYIANFAALQSALRQLDDSSASCVMTSLAKTSQGRDVWLLTLSANPETAASRPAVLVVAGLDARHRVGVEIALRAAKNLLNDHADLLKDHTFYIVACANPDGFEFASAKPNATHVGNMRPIDSDRDGAADENGFADLNGDGVITQMRRLDPPLDDRATHLPDPNEPRLMKRADAAKGERAIYSLHTEGADTDDDGQIGEDGTGGVDLDRNFLHRYPEHAMDAGPIPLSEPETLAIADFVIARKNIIAAVTYGRHDNLINVPDGRGTDVSGQGPRDLDAGDVEYYREIAKKYKEITGQSRAAGSDTAGSFQAWIYAQRGIPSFASTVWGRPDVKDPAASAPASQPEAADGGAKPQATENAAQPEQAQPPQPARRGGGRRGGPPTGDAPTGGTASGGGGGAEGKPEDAEGAAWLKYSDTARNKEGFIDWKPFDHPTLGKVEIGGFVPGFQMNPPAAELDEIGTKQTAFIVDLVARRPRLSVQGPTIEKLADGLYEVRLGVSNEGYLPTATAMARKARSIMPSVVRISTPVDQIVTGDRVIKTWGVGGSGDRVTYRWIVRAANGSDISIEINNPHFGDQKVSVKAE